MSRRGFMTAGCWIIDRNLLVEYWPAENGFAPVLEEVLSGGGSTYNLAANLKSLDPEVPVAVTALAADDREGAFLRDLALRSGIDITALTITDEAGTDEALCFASASSGRRTHIGKFGTARLVSPDHLVFDGSNAKLAHFGLPGIHRVMDAPWNGEPNGWVAALKKARAAGLKTNMELVSVHAERIAELIRPCLPHLDLLVVNDHEAGGIAGIATVEDGLTDRAACERAAKWMLQNGAVELVAIHYPAGGTVVTRDGTVAEHPSVNVPDEDNNGANGAGDAFAAGFLYGWHEEWPLQDSLALANAAAAASLRDMTTTRAVSDWRSCLDLANRWGWRHIGEAVPSG